MSIEEVPDLPAFLVSLRQQFVDSETASDHMSLPRAISRRCAELLSVGLERHAEYCVAEAPCCD
jgi:hypothetical protein